MAGDAVGPLQGVRVIDLTIWVQGPMAATLLADLGADVIKIERAGGGDFARGLTTLHGVDLRRDDAPNLLWATCNRNKRALTLDLRNASAAPVLRRLIATAHVFLTNLHPDALAELGATEDTVRAINPSIVYARGAGLGETGPRALDPCQDTVGMAYSGFMYTVAAGEEPYYPPGALADVLAGTMLAFGVLAALEQRRRTGEGQSVSASQLQALLWLQSLSLGVAANLGTPFSPSDRTRPGSPMVNTYRCGDGRWIALGVVRSDQWRPLLEAVGIPVGEIDERFPGFKEMRRKAPEIVAMLDERFATAPASTWIERLRGGGFWASPVQRVADLLSDEQVTANDYLLRLRDGWRVAGMPFFLHGYAPPLEPAPDYGADSEEVLTALGYSTEQITGLRADGAVW